MTEEKVLRCVLGRRPADIRPLGPDSHLVDPTGTRRVTSAPGVDEHALTPADLHFTDFALAYAGS